MKESSTKKKASEGMSPFSGRSMSQSQGAAVPYFNVGQDMDVPSDDSDGGESQQQKDIRRQRGRKPKPILSSITKTKDLFSGAASRIRRCRSAAATVDAFGFHGQLTGTDMFSMGRPGSATSATTTGQTSSSSSQDFFNDTQNMNELISQSQDIAKASNVVENGVNGKEDSSETEIDLDEGRHHSEESGVIGEKDAGDHESTTDVKVALNLVSTSKWVLFSVRNPVWDYFLLHADRPIPLEEEVFKNMVLDAVSKGYMLPRFCQQSNIGMLRVREMNANASETGDLEIHGQFCIFSDYIQPQQKPDLDENTNATLSISSFEIQKLLLGLVHRNDIIMCLASSSSSFANAEDIQINYIHLSSKNTNEGKDLMECLLDLPADVQMDICSPYDADAGRSYSVMRFARCDNGDESRSCLAECTEIAPMEPKSVADSNAKVDEEIILMEPEVVARSLNSDERSQEIECIELSDDEDPVIPDVDLTNSTQRKNNIIDASVNNTEEINKLRGADVILPPQPNRDINGGSTYDVVDDLIGSVGNAFNLQDFLQSVDFVPGPMRPKLRKADPSSGYTYQKLSKLEEEIMFIVERESRNDALVCPMIPTPCNVYGIVDKTTPDHRHPDSYLIRISDETKRSVLVRLHKLKTEQKGPQIEVSDIIRIHRLTVQNEWDPEYGENTMVLSTASHRNYVIFRTGDDGSLRFEYDTTAKSITLNDEVDLPRIAELFGLRPVILPTLEDVFESSQISDSGPERLENDDIDVITRIDLAGPPGAAIQSQSRSASDGICDSDIVTPDFSVSNSLDDGEMEIEEEVSFREDQGVEEIPNLNTTNASDESFATAVCDSSVMSRISTANPTVTEVNEKENVNDSMRERTPVRGVASPIPNPCQEMRSGPVTSFKDLRKTDSEISVMFKLVSRAASAHKNVYHLVIKDIENSSPPKDFLRKLRLLGELQNDVVVLDIINAAKFATREIMDDLNDVQGTDEILIIDGVKVKGDSPPYICEADGKTCVVRRSTPNDLKFLNLDDSFTCSMSSTVNHSNIPILNAEIEQRPLDVVDSDHHPDVDSVTLSQCLSTQNGKLKRPAEAESDDESCGSGSQSSEASSSAANKSSNVAIEPWTGKRTGKRKRRLFYRDT